MYEVFVKTHFSAAHHLTGYPGNCSRWHGHNWEVTVFVETAELNGIGISVDFRTIKERVRELLEEMDHTDLNEHPAFQGRNPTSETIAEYLYRQLAARINQRGLRVSRVTVSETPGTGASFFE
jgi:6-pyruvoyltetrahydropterin/6-carboxytetrahydropterin synthase